MRAALCAAALLVTLPVALPASASCPVKAGATAQSETWQVAHYTSPCYVGAYAGPCLHVRTVSANGTPGPERTTPGNVSGFNSVWGTTHTIVVCSYTKHANHTGATPYTPVLQKVVKQEQVKPGATFDVRADLSKGLEGKKPAVTVDARAARGKLIDGKAFTCASAADCDQLRALTTGRQGARPGVVTLKLRHGATRTAPLVLTGLKR